MFKKLSLIALSLTLLTSCVSKKIFTDLETKYANLKKENRSLSDENGRLQSELTKAKKELKDMTESYDSAVTDRNLWENEYKALIIEHENLEASYKALEENSSASIAANSKKNRELLAQLEAKGQALTAENQRLEKLKKELENRSKRVTELENVIAAKDANMRALKDAISKALTNFEGKGLTVEQRDGKVYISMENKLLFQSGSWSVGTEGKKAVQQLGNVLAENPDIAVLIEGHTDNVPMRSKYNITNWNLAFDRAYSVLKTMIGAGFPRERVSISSYGETKPIINNSSKENRALNRRIEIVVVPDLSKLPGNGEIEQMFSKQ